MTCASVSRSGRLESAAEAVRAYGCRALAIPTDVADAEAVDAAATRVEAELGPIDVWVNVAMATVFGPVNELTAEEVERGTKVTYLGQVHGMMAALKRMRTRNRGTIVNVGSALAYGPCRSRRSIAAPNSPSAALPTRFDPRSSTTA